MAIYNQKAMSKSMFLKNFIRKEKVECKMVPFEPLRRINTSRNFYKRHKNKNNNNNNNSNNSSQAKKYKLRTSKEHSY